MNIVIPFRNTCGIDELSMCIRLIKKNLKIKYDKIYIVGDEFSIPNNMIENIVIEEQKYSKWLDSNFLVLNYINKIGEPFILFNDDFFLTDTVEKIPHYYYSNLKNRLLTTYVINEKNNTIRLSNYGLNIKAFLNMYGNYENYEVHIPIVINYPNIMLEAINLCNMNDCPALKRTMYIKLCEEYNMEMEITELDYDVKFNEPLRVIQYPFFSLTDNCEFKAFKKELEEIADARED